ncbi:MAG: hypothetical protein KAI79_02440, partial [Bacteroidales bacterium]|nr:hypothetical protein [Bacteroidales bacterium]
LTMVFGTQAQMILQYDGILASGTITLPLAGTVNVDVDWGDGNSETVTTADPLNHTYASGGNYTVTITILEELS